MNSEAQIRILTIEDEAPVRKSIAAYLEDHEYDVIQAENGEIGLELARREHPDAILVDLRMPGISGLTVLKEVTNELPEIPIIVVSGTGDLLDVVETLKLGAWDFVIKPIHDMAILKHSIDTNIKKASLIRENRKHQEQLEKTNEEIRAFSYTLSHDLRTPLHAIVGFSSLLEDASQNRLDEKSAEYLARIRQAATRMQQMIEDLLTLSHLSLQEMTCTTVDLSSLSQSILDNLKIHEPKRTVNVIIQDNLTANGNSGLLKNVMENLLGDAWKYTGKVSNAKIEFGKQDTKNGEAFFIRDNGAGFDMKHSKKLFGVFQRLHSNEEFEGTGVGLATVKKIIERHEGNIWAEATLGKGATFFFTLPSS